MTQRRIISADSHFLEPPDLWTERLDVRYRERGPHTIVKKGVTFVTGEDLHPQAVSGWCAAGHASEDLGTVNQLGWDAAPPGVWSPEARLADQDRDGIAAEILYASFGMIAMNIGDVELAMASLRVFNDYAAEYCAHDPKRLIGIGAVIPDDVEAAVTELERIGKLGLRGALIPMTLAPGDSYADPKFDPIWAAAQEMRLVLSFHAGTSRVPVATNRHVLPALYMGAHHIIQRLLTDLILTGVLDRFPGLRFTSVENDVGWLPHYASRLGHFAERFGALAVVKLQHHPVDYLRNHFYSCFTFEGEGVEAVRQTLGSEVLMWGNDYPHLDSSWPHSRGLIGSSLEQAMPAADVDNILSGNVSRLYGLELAN
jgi:predicted TIM-barrel fold metal-dependent hydrolase